MASKAFLAALAATKESKNVESVLVGSNYMSEGTHDVTIKAVDTAKIDEGKIDVTYINDEGKEYRDQMYLTSKDGELSFGVRLLLSAVIPDTAALEAFLDLAARDDKAFELFTGMKLRITLEPGPGIQARATGSGTFAGFDVKSNEKVTEEFEDIKAVYDDVKAKELKRSYLRPRNLKDTSSESNVPQFFAAVKARESGKSSGITGAQFATGKVV
jgi:hypothetical protein